MKNDAGFVSASFHASDDGRRILNYAQWLSKEDWIKSRGSGDDDTVKIAEQTSSPDKATAAIAEAIKRLGARTVKVDTFKVARVVERE